MLRAESARQPLIQFRIGGKSGLHRVERLLTAGARERTESAAESRPPLTFEVRGKGERVW